VCQQELQTTLRAYVEHRRSLRRPIDLEKDITTTPKEMLVEVLNLDWDGHIESGLEVACSTDVKPSVLNDLTETNANSGPDTNIDSRQLTTRLAMLVEEWVRTADEKLNLAQSAYNSTDRHVRILDMTISDQEKAVSKSLVTISPANALLPSPSNDAGLPTVVNVMQHKPVRQLGRKVAPPNPASETATRKAPPRRKLETPPRSNIVGSQAAMDMAILPNEPVYCYCNQVSHGSMIACDNKNCAREWFHYACVGLLEAPTGGKPWYCSDCSDALGRNGRRKR